MALQNDAVVVSDVTTTEICFALSHFSRTNTQQQSTHAGGIASRVTMRPLE
jgi:hypothetical protein